MKLSLNINKEFSELIYCQKHQEWFYVDDENNCCYRELLEESESHDC